MMFSPRTILSLSQYLELQGSGFLDVLFRKHELPEIAHGWGHSVISEVENLLLEAQPNGLISLLGEILNTTGNLRYGVNPKYLYDERWDDLTRCFYLDGFLVEGGQLIPIDPTIEGTEKVDDDLNRELRDCGLEGMEEVAGLLAKSTNAFLSVPPDYNACLTDVRVALETVAKAIAVETQDPDDPNFDNPTWGQALNFLRQSNFLTQRDETGIAGVYTFVSQGAHVPLGMSVQEMARLGRSLVIGMIYFLVKHYRGRESSY